MLNSTIQVHLFILQSLKDNRVLYTKNKKNTNSQKPSGVQRLQNDTSRKQMQHCSRKVTCITDKPREKLKARQNSRLNVSSRSNVYGTWAHCNIFAALKTKSITISAYSTYSSLAVQLDFALRSTNNNRHPLASAETFQTKH